MDNIKNIIPEIINSLVQGRPELQMRLEQAWTGILGEEAKKHTKITGFKKGRLAINVDSPVWLFHLHFKRQQLLVRMQKDFPELTGMTFRVGRIK